MLRTLLVGVLIVACGACRQNPTRSLNLAIAGVIEVDVGCKVGDRYRRYRISATCIQEQDGPGEFEPLETVAYKSSRVVWNQQLTVGIKEFDRFVNPQFVRVYPSSTSQPDSPLNPSLGYRAPVTFSQSGARVVIGTTRVGSFGATGFAVLDVSTNEVLFTWNFPATKIDEEFRAAKRREFENVEDLTWSPCGNQIAVLWTHYRVARGPIDGIGAYLGHPVFTRDFHVEVFDLRSEASERGPGCVIDVASDVRLGRGRIAWRSAE